MHVIDAFFFDNSQIAVKFIIQNSVEDFIVIIANIMKVSQAV